MALAQHHSCSNLFTQLGMGHGKGDDLGHRWMVHQHVIHLAWRDFFAATVDDLLQPPGQRQITLRIEHALIASAKPAVDESLEVCRRVVFITGGYVVATDHDLAHGAGWQQFTATAHDGDLRPGGEPNRAGDAPGGRQRAAGHLVRSFGHAVRLDQRCAENAFDFRNHLRRHGRRRRANEAQRMCGNHLGVAGRTAQDGLVHGRHCGVPGWLAFTHPGEKAQGIEARRAKDLAANRHRRQQAGDQSMDMEQRHHMELPVLRRELQGVADITCRGAQVGLCQRHDLGPRRGARGMQYQCHIIRLRWPAVGRCRYRNALCMQRKTAGTLLWQGSQLQHPDAQFRGHSHHGAVTALGHDDGACLQVG